MHRVYPIFRIVCLLLVLGQSFRIQADSKENLVSGHFRSDTIRVGETVTFVLTYRHNPAQEVLFPDSTYQFYPFELVKRSFFPTYTDSTGSTDSVSYELTTFELEDGPGLEISLPVYIIEDGDTSETFSPPATVYLIESIKSPPENSRLKANTRLLEVAARFNYPYLLLATGGVLLLMVLTFLVFGKRLRRQYRIYRMERSHKQFMIQYQKLEEQLMSDKNTYLLEAILSVWKGYLQKLTGLPFTTYTTREIGRAMDYLQLSSSLQNFDRAIYGRIISEDLTRSIEVLRETAEARYKQKREEVWHA